MPGPVIPNNTPIKVGALQAFERCHVMGVYKTAKKALAARKVSRPPAGTYTTTWIMGVGMAIADGPIWFRLTDAVRDPGDTSGKPPRPPQAELLQTKWVELPICPTTLPADPPTPAPPPPADVTGARPRIGLERLQSLTAHELGDHPDDASALAAHRAAGGAGRWSTGFIDLQGVAISPEGGVYDMPLRKTAPAMSGPAQRPPQRAEMQDAPRR